VEVSGEEVMTTETALAVVIPTRNRGALASAAIRSVLDSAIDRVSIFISDNSSERGDVDSLFAFCARVHDPRVTYLRPPAPLGMTDHWNWALDSSISASRPTHVTFLTDRMMFQPGGLKALLDVVGSWPEDVVSFNFDSVDDRSTPVRLAQTAWSGKTLRIASKKFLDMAANADVIQRSLPRMLNSAVPVPLLDEMRRRFGQVFGSLSPDYCFSYRCLSLVPTTLYLDRPCIIDYAQGRSLGRSVVAGRQSPELGDFIGFAGARGLNFAAPIPSILTASNAVIHEYCFVASELGDGTMKPVAMQPYLTRLASEVARLEDEDLRREYYEVLSGHGLTSATLPSVGPVGTRLAELRRNPVQFATKVRRALPSRILGHHITKPLWLRMARWGIHPPGQQRFHFCSTDEALEYARRYPRRPNSTVAHLGPLAQEPVVEDPLIASESTRCS